MHAKALELKFGRLSLKSSNQTVNSFFIIVLTLLMFEVNSESKVNSYGCSCDIGAREKIALKESVRL